MKAETRKVDPRGGTVVEVKPGMWYAYSATKLVNSEEGLVARRYVVRRVGNQWSCNCQSHYLCWHVMAPLRTALRSAGWGSVQFRNSKVEARAQHRRTLEFFRNKRPFYVVVGKRQPLPDRVRLRYEQYTMRGMSYTKRRFQVCTHKDEWRDSKLDWVYVTKWLHEHGYEFKGRFTEPHGFIKITTETWERTKGEVE